MGNEDKEIENMEKSTEEKVDDFKQALAELGYEVEDAGEGEIRISE